MSGLQLIVVFVTTLILSCEGLPNGAPTSVCSSLIPKHGAEFPQTSPPLYSVTAVIKGDVVEVELSSLSSEGIEGFVLQARSSSDRDRMIDGEFSVTDGVSKTIDCFDGTQNTLTHSNSNVKRIITTEWTPSAGLNEDVVFRATVVKTLSLFWTEIDSPPVRIRTDESRNLIKEETDSNLKYQNCFVSKGCAGMPTGCIDRRDCEFFISYTATMDGVFFNMQGFLEPLTYMAMALSMDNLMGDDSVTECFRDGPNVVVRESFNKGKSNILTREIPKDEYIGEFTNGLTTCSWIKKYVTESNGITFNLANSTYYLLLAKGPVINDTLGHHSTRIASQEPLNFTAFGVIGAEGVSDSTEIHGVTVESSMPSVDESNEYNTDSTEASSEVYEDPFVAVSIEKLTESLLGIDSFATLCRVVCLALKVIALDHLAIITFRLLLSVIRGATNFQF